MRGSQSLFADIVFNDTLPPKERKGRNNTLQVKRNECLIDRYFFYAKLIGYNYPKVLEMLESEFFLCISTIPQIMEKPDNQLYLRRLKMEQPTKQHFEKKWPHIKWAA
ncbi:hypothetical protein ESA94_20355 [Lacibacter luteus]|uniref:Uncharacterized protein n=1 Tax=Lacibacter luteus TaxID=2508719 RepID=A0A4Q1CDT3_9BACT|nr:hypothetical protein [Lacibacter luteus]RXK57553.1 hypothetical protein ESA94_20355 [Lacibacter luteus]